MRALMQGTRQAGELAAVCPYLVTIPKIIVLPSFQAAGVSAKENGKCNCQRNAHVIDWKTVITECFKFLNGKGAGIAWHFLIVHWAMTVRLH